MASKPTGNPVGRPTKYRKKHCNEVIATMTKGQSLTAFCAEINVDKDTVYQWAKKHPEFTDALKTAQRNCQAFWEKMLQATAMGKMPGASLGAQIFWLKNRFPNDWRDKIEQEVTMSNIEPVVIETDTRTIEMSMEDKGKDDG